MKTILCEEYQKERILQALSEGAGGSLTDILVKSLKNIFSPEKEEEASVLLMMSFLLNKDKENYPVYGDMFNFPSFLQEILSFAKECILYEISPSSLPERNSQEKELKRILQTVLKMDFIEKIHLQKREERIKELLSDPDVSIFPYFENDPYYYRIRERLLLNIPEEKTEEYQPVRHLRFALNMRQEIEAVAQDICKKKTPCTVILCNPSSYLPVLQEVFHRYNIPYSVSSETNSVKMSGIYNALARLAIKKDIPSFLEALRKDAFPVLCKDSLIRFFEDVLVEFHSLIDISSHLENSLFKSSIRFIQPLENEANAYLEKINDSLTYLLESTDAKDALIRAYSIMQKSSFLQDKNELMAAMKIRTALTESLDLIHSEEEAIFLLDLILSLTASSSVYCTDFCQVTDLKRPLPASETAYVLGCSGTAYPGFQAKKGLFDEAYLSQIPLYPSMEERYDIYTSQLEWISNSAKNNLYYSYANNDYQGREIQLSFVIETMFGKEKPTKWELESLAPYKENAHSLLPETAALLFKGDGYIHGSISTIERYFQCAYSYFLQSGLKLRDNEIGNLDARTTGEIAHSVLEHAILKYGKDYTKIPKEELKEIIHESFTALDHIHPVNTVLHQLSEERLFRQLLVALEFLEDFEKCTAFVPEAVERKFEEEIVPGVKLRGTIDRLNTFANLAEIIDYKSSTHALAKPKVLAGIQLQLLTYAVIARRIFQKDIAGAYYFSFKEEAVSVEALKKVRKEIKETIWSKEEEKERMIHARMMKGWTFLDRFTEIDDGKKHISLSSVYNFEDIEEIINALYTCFQDSLLDGNIALNPLEDACGFCELKSICRFHGLFRKMENVIGMTLEKGGKDEI